MIFTGSQTSPFLQDVQVEDISPNFFSEIGKDLITTPLHSEKNKTIIPDSRFLKAIGY